MADKILLHDCERDYIMRDARKSRNVLRISLATAERRAMFPRENLKGNPRYPRSYPRCSQFRDAREFSFSLESRSAIRASSYRDRHLLSHPRACCARRAPRATRFRNVSFKSVGIHCWDC